MTASLLRVATWNIHMAIGQDGQRDLERTARVIRAMDPDLIGLQEVDNRIVESGNDLDSLSHLTDLEYVSGPTMQRSDGDYGNALLTRLPVRDIERYDLSVPGREPRGLLIVHLQSAGSPLQAAVTHLGLRPGERRVQVRKLVDYLATGDRTPLLLMGDFNEWLFWGRPLRWLRAHFGQGRSPASFPARWPLLRLDHILSDPQERLFDLGVFKSQLAKHASDHLPLLATYRI